MIDNRLKSAGIATACFFLTTLTACDQEKIITQNELPQEVSSYIRKNFPNAKVAQAVQDREGLGKSYNITLSDGISLEFNGKEVTDIKSNHALPDAAVPQQIRSYVTENYPGTAVTQWETDGNGQQAKLDNGIELQFNKAGDFQRIDQ